MKLLAGFYVLCTFVDWLTFYWGKNVIEENDILCYKGNTIFTNSNTGGLYMIFYSVVEYMYALFMWYTFYQVPKRHGVVTRRNVEKLSPIGQDESAFIMAEGEEKLKTVVRELEHDRKFIRNQQRNKTTREASKSDYSKSSAQESNLNSQHIININNTVTESRVSDIGNTLTYADSISFIEV